MAFVHQESGFVDDARPPRRRLLWIIPWTRGSSAYGYAQAQDATWDWYIRKTGNSGADRDDIDDALDFVGWFVDTTHRMTGVAKNDAYRNYLAYHEGQGGYKRGTYRKKDWLLAVARKVQRRAQRYAGQLHGCRDELESERTSWWPF